MYESNEPPPMKEFFTFLVLLILIAAAYFQRDKWLTPPPPQIVYVTPKPTPTPPLRHLAPEGTFYLVEYLSVPVPHGVVGFVPGQMVHFVSADEAKGTLLVTDGTHQAEVGPMQITNDLDIAAIARRQDQASQGQLQAAQQAAWQMDEKLRQQVNIDHAKSVAGMRSGSSIGSQTSLNKSSEAASSFDRADQRNGAIYGYPYYGSPYSYLHRSYYSSNGYY